MNKPLVAVVGRPNVGKSTFFNKVCGKRVSIVDDTPGVTRDRLYEDAEWCGKVFTLIDTGGLDSKSDDNFQNEIKQQADVAIDTADVIVFIVDGKTGLTENDEEVAKILRKTNKPVILVVNKLDNFEVENTYEFFSLGLGEPMPVSCEQGKGLGDVLDKIVENFPANLEEIENNPILKIAIVGRPNVGKSSLINRLTGNKRVVVSNIEGTTRDSVLVPFKYNKEDYYLIDTAGMRRKRSYDNSSVESYSVIRSMEAISKADVVILVLDALQEITEQDVRIAGMIHEEGKPSLILINKWDKAEESKQDFMLKLKKELAFMDYFVCDFVSALEGTKVGQIMPQVLEVYSHSSMRLTTGVLNDMLADAILSNEPPSKKGRRLKINYITQVSINPPTFVLFVNDATLMHFSYLRYLENRFREKCNFSGTPLKFIVRNKEDKNARS